MEFWSKGLGRRSLGIDCGSEAVEVVEGKTLLKGIVRPPLSWEYTISMDAEDWMSFFEVALHPTILQYLLKPKRWGILLRAGVQLTLFFARYLLALVSLRFSSP